MILKATPVAFFCGFHKLPVPVLWAPLRLCQGAVARVHTGLCVLKKT